MTAEGTFPKIDGDILYASEVNNLFHVNNYLLGAIGSLSTGTGNQFTWTSTGSILAATDENIDTYWAGSLISELNSGANITFTLPSESYYNSLIIKYSVSSEENCKIDLYASGSNGNTLFNSISATTGTTSTSQRNYCSGILHQFDKINFYMHNDFAGSSVLKIYEIGVL